MVRLLTGSLFEYWSLPILSLYTILFPLLCSFNRFIQFSVLFTLFRSRPISLMIVNSLAILWQFFGNFYSFSCVQNFGFLFGRLYKSAEKTQIETLN